jgi:hypothetical protein
VASAQTGAASSNTSTTPDQPVPAPQSVAEAPSSTAPTSATGLTGQTSVQNQLQASRVLPGGTTSQEPVNITQVQQVSVVNGGAGLAASGGACAGPPCASPVTAGAHTPTNQPTQALTGAATAQGLVANNAVTTLGTASVSVLGRNFAPIQVVIDALTSIANFGSASAVTGSASASSAPDSGVGASGAAAASGAAQATGAQVSNQIDLRSSASVHVLGDNHTPITIVEYLAAYLLNMGVGTARSGDAQTSGATSVAGALASADTGAATATGLVAQNAVSMQAAASVQVDGDNYAPIVILIRFFTMIDNRGWGQASTGTAQARHISSSPAASTSSTSLPNATPVSAPLRTATAQSGSATVSGDNVNIGVVSVQSANANGTAGTGPANAQPAGALAEWWAAASGSVPPPPTPADGAASSSVGSQAISGAALAVGMHMTVDSLNVQNSVCATPGTACTAANSVNMLFEAEPAPTPDPPIPTIQSPVGGGSSSPGGGSRAGNKGTHSPDRGDAPAIVSGPSVLVSPFADVAARRLPPLPKQPPRGTSGFVVAQDPWNVSTTVDRLPPLPGLNSEETAVPVAYAAAEPIVRKPGPAAGARPTQPQASGGRASPTAAPEHLSTVPGNLETPSEAQPGVEVNPAPAVPQSQDPSPPGQLALTAPIPSVSAQSDAGDLAEVALARIDQGTPATLATPLDPFVFGAGAIAATALVAAGAANTRRGRRWVARQLRHWSTLTSVLRQLLGLK